MANTFCSLNILKRPEAFDPFDALSLAHAEGAKLTGEDSVNKVRPEMEGAPVQLDQGWKEFFTTAAGASATLVGLVIVAISVNVQRILDAPQLPSRGGATVASLVLILVSSLAGLIPQPSSAFAIELTAFGLVVWLLHLWSARQIIVVYLKSRDLLRESLLGIAIGQIQSIPFLVGGIFLLYQQTAGFYWIAWAMIITFILSVVNTWVLLVEILR
jgi:hypothetical protein